jgi:mannan endo-1,4-beta-mannosidase
VLNNTGQAVTGQKCGDWFDDRVREVAAIINQFVDDEGKPIPMLFRLWHELDGWWAWWQVHDTTGDQYKRFFRLTVDKFREYCPNAEILWVYNTDVYSSGSADAYLRYYPGDDYVDIMGYDDYNLGKVAERENCLTRAQVVSATAREHGKVAMLCETLRAAEETTANQDIFFQDFVWPVVAADDVSLSVFQVWGGADNTALRKESFKWWYDNEKTIFSKRY